MTVAFISHPDCLRHNMGAEHIEQPARLTAISDYLIASGLDAFVSHYDAPLATREQIVRVHAEDYVDRIIKIAPSDGFTYLDPDTIMNPYTLRAAQRAAGAAVLGVDLVLRGDASQAFCNVRPPGHHAERARAMGFCIFNNIAVGAAHALESHGLSKVAIVDFDVHHGNGTEDIFRMDERVLFCSSFQHPFYPGSGTDTQANHIVNMPLPAGTTGAEYRQLVEDHWLPALDEFAPELILVSAGFDGHAEDPISQLLLTDDDYVWITKKIAELASRHAKKRIVSTLEGGYTLATLARCARAHIEALSQFAG